MLRDTETASHVRDERHVLGLRRVQRGLQVVFGGVVDRRRVRTLAPVGLGDHELLPRIDDGAFVDPVQVEQLRERQTVVGSDAPERVARLHGVRVRVLIRSSGSAALRITAARLSTSGPGGAERQHVARVDDARPAQIVPREHVDRAQAVTDRDARDRVARLNGVRRCGAAGVSYVGRACPGSLRQRRRQRTVGQGRFGLGGDSGSAAEDECNGPRHGNGSGSEHTTFTGHELLPLGRPTTHVGRLLPCHALVTVSTRDNGSC